MNPSNITAHDAMTIIVKLRMMARASSRAAAGCPRLDDALAHSNYAAGLLRAASIVGDAAGIASHEVIPDDGTWDE